ncbi:hypothetical protein SAZ11_14720 [Streptomyces sp. FXJ1.4098]|nr:hypothetical protein [Streptomyces sp. FXJ1.4098]
MFDFGIQGYRPHWMRGPRAVRQLHGARLRTLIGRPLARLWVVWDLEDDEWFPDCPVLLDFDGEQVEINHWKLDELSLTWNAIDPRRPVEWPGFALQWRDGTIPEAAPLLGHPSRTSNSSNGPAPTRPAEPSMSASSSRTAGSPSITPSTRTACPSPRRTACPGRTRSAEPPWRNNPR